ncbi:MAG TPA: transglutaminase-like domain-containing protein, partial [Spirillospora sp.]|nr:transglutaminase-like domain-containing protein [Spirillospora sp.]
CFSDSDKLVDLFKDLPDDLSELCRIVRGIYVHYRAKNLPATVHERLKEADSRYLSRILDRIVTLDNSDLVVARPPERRFIGCCRDASLLLCSMLRHKGIPTRIRVGFATYIPAEAPFSYTDHVITEYWNTDSGRWQMVDSEQDETLINQNRIDFDVHDIPQDKFVAGGRAWLMGRENARLWEAFGINDFVKGRWFVAGYLIRDFAALNRDEVLLWDS